MFWNFEGVTHKIHLCMYKERKNSELFAKVHGYFDNLIFYWKEKQYLKLDFYISFCIEPYFWFIIQKMNPNILRTKYFARTQGYETLWVIEQSLAHHIYSIKLLSSMFQFLHSMHLIIVHATMLQQFTVESRFFVIFRHFSMHFILWPDWYSKSMSKQGNQTAWCFIVQSS